MTDVIFRVAQLVASGVIGGFLGGWVMAYRIGAWRQQIEDRLGVAEKRLNKGEGRVDAVPVLEARLDTVLDELRALRVEARDDRAEFVRRETCDARHERA